MEDKTLDEIHTFMVENKDRLPMWTIYKAEPSGFVARIWFSLPDPVLLTMAMHCDDLKPLQERMKILGLACMNRFEQDDPMIVETWI